MIASIVAIVALAALLAYREYTHAQERKLFIAERDSIAERSAKERAELAQRIQAPQMAVMEHHDFDPPRSLPYDDDEAFWKSREDMLNG